MTAQNDLQAALAHHQAGRLAEAEGIYRQILARFPDHPDALHFLGMLASQMGGNYIAVELISKAIALMPDNAACRVNLGAAYDALGRLDEAIASYQRALAIQPNFAEAHYNMGNALKGKGLLDEAITSYQRALAIKSNYAKACNSMGTALYAKDRLDEAIASFQRALAIKPDYAEAHYNMGATLQAKDLLDEAIASYQRALAIKPNYLEALYNMGNALQVKGLVDEAIASFQKTLAIKPDFAEAHNNLGNALKIKGLLDEAIASYQQALTINPDYAEAHSNLVFTLYYSPKYDRSLILREARRWNEQHAVPLKTFLRPHDNVPDPHRRLRVGYVSPDFGQHPVGLNMLPLIRSHDRERFEICCYAEVAAPDPVTRRFRSCADIWRSTVGLSDSQLADLIRNDHIDILVDLAMHTAHGRPLTMARKPAPVQVAFAAYPGTTGLDAIDYRLTDPHLDPPGEHDEWYNERSIRLPDSFWCYDPLTSEPAVNPLPALASGRVTFGSLNAYCKVNEGTLRLWARVLGAVPDSRMLILSPAGDHRPRALEVFQSEGIDPGRIEWFTPAPRPEYLRAYHRIDIGLDPDPYNGHTTSLDSFWMGVPVVTLVGRTVVGRAGLCQAMNLGLSELVAWTPEQYVQRAVELADDVPRLAEMRAGLRQRMQASPLMNGPRFARNVESAFREMWIQWCQSRKPD